MKEGKFIFPTCILKDLSEQGQTTLACDGPQMQQRGGKLQTAEWSMPKAFS